jgi:PRTRC genetic system protein E
MFKELMPVISDRPLTITVAAIAGGKIKLCVVPQSQEKDGKVNSKVGYQAEKELAKIPDSAIRALTTPLALTGTPEELDAGLAEQLTTYAASHVQLQHGLAQATQEITNAVKAIEDRNKAKSKSKTDTGKKDPVDAPSEKKTAPEPDPNATLPLAWCTSAVPATAVSANDQANQRTEVTSDQG